MFNPFRRRAESAIPDGETVPATIESVTPAHDRAGFTVVYRSALGTRTAFLPCDPLPRGGDRVRKGRLLNLQVVDDGKLIIEVAEVVATRRGLFA